MRGVLGGSLVGRITLLKVFENPGKVAKHVALGVKVVQEAVHVQLEVAAVAAVDGVNPRLDS